ncbi:MAG TPA: transglutaminase-like cysteine peptidase [Sphingomicrobium sp.]|nr:transglutaminase-like cysteine peptidase [Sphingomicrobium sp.]
MQHLRLFRALLGSAGLAGCIALLAGQARAQASNFVPQAAPIIVTANGPPLSPDLFGTVAVPVRIERYAAGWRRAALDASRLPSMLRLVAPARTLGRDQQVAYIQAAVTRRIRWISDATEWGQHDYWASAAETLQHGAGDMEDRAIVKMQALRTLGFAPRDLYLTIGRDKVGGQITVLLARVGRKVYVLDDLGGSPILADRRQGFEPMLTLGHNVSWIHGRRVAQANRTGVATGAPR